MPLERWAWEEMGGADLPDLRQRKSVAHLYQKVTQRAERSFSAAAGPDGRQAARRLFTRKDLTTQQLLRGHLERTRQRCAGQPLVLVSQDTTALEYGTHLAAEGLGPISDTANSRGFFAHSALAMTEAGVPLGLVSLRLWVRSPAELGKKVQRRVKVTGEKESRKWLDALADTEATLPAGLPVLLIQDREADVFAFLAAPRRPETDLLVRASQPRRVRVPETDAEAEVGTARARTGNLFALVAQAPVLGTVTVRVPRQSARPRVEKREEREAHLTVRVLALEIQPPRRKGVTRQPQLVWVVLAQEEQPPAQGQRVSWTLITTLPVPNFATACRVLTYYSRRWQSERLHYTLKSGCGAEKLQLDSAPKLQHAVALYFVVAWRLLYLTHLAREVPDTPASTVLTEVERKLLERKLQQPVHTVAVAVRGLARLAGKEEYRGAGPPGVKTLWLGLRQLQAMVEGWELALSLMNHG